MKLDFSEVEEFVPVAEGKYAAEIVRSAEGLSKRAGQRKWAMQFEVKEDPQHDGEYIGKTIKWDISLQKQALWKVLQTLRGLGEELEDEEDLKNFEFDAENYVGRTCALIVGSEIDPTYGKRTRVQRLEPVDVMA